MSEPIAVTPPRGQTAVVSVVAQLTDLIYAEMTPGLSLPSEAEMAARYGVSRVTIREAIKMLAGRGLVEISRGRRAVISEPSGKALGEFLGWIVQYDPKGMFDLVEVRMSLEIKSVSLAAKRATRPALAGIENMLQGMRDAGRELEQREGDLATERLFHQCDVGFHEAIALASGNRVITSLIEAMSVPLERSFFMSRRGKTLRGLPLESTIAAHQKILDCIKKRDSAAAENAMRLHLEESGRDMRAAFENRPAQAGNR